MHHALKLTGRLPFPLCLLFDISHWIQATINAIIVLLFIFQDCKHLPQQTIYEEFFHIRQAHYFLMNFFLSPFNLIHNFPRIKWNNWLFGIWITIKSIGLHYFTYNQLLRTTVICTITQITCTPIDKSMNMFSCIGPIFIQRLSWMTETK